MKHTLKKFIVIVVVIIFLINSYNISNKEFELHEWIKEYIEIETNKRFYKNKLRGYELDVFIPSLNLGIEFDGLYWHNELYKENTYHIDKTKYFKENYNIEVIHLFEDEWDNQKDIVKSIILNKLGLNEKIYGRKTIIKELSNDEYKDFMEENHIQGYCASKIKVGLLYNNELVSAIGISKSRFKKGEMELIRYANKLNTSILGGFSKLIKYATKTFNIDELNTYCDLRFFNASGYNKIGFEEVSRTKPNFYIVNKGIRENRMKYQKHKLEHILKNYNPSLTAHENTINNKLFRIYDCGNIKLKY